MTNGNQLTREEQAWLVEYQACQHESDSNSLRYWTLTGIFIGFSSVLLGGLLYGMLANIQAITLASAKDACTLRTIISVLGAAMVTVLVFLRLWLKRINYLMDTNYERMHEIELRLGMWKSLRVRVLDTWNKMRRKLGFKTLNNLPDEKVDEIWQKTLEGKELVKGLSEESLGLLADKQEELFEICYRSKPQRCYESPSRHLHFPVILYILIGLWVFLIVMAFLIV